MGSDYTAMNKIKNYLNLREKLVANEPGRMVHGRELKAPLSTIKKKVPTGRGHKRNDLALDQSGDQLSMRKTPTPSQLQLNYVESFNCFQ